MIHYSPTSDYKQRARRCRCRPVVYLLGEGGRVEARCPCRGHQERWRIYLQGRFEWFLTHLIYALVQPESFFQLALPATLTLRALKKALDETVEHEFDEHPKGWPEATYLDLVDPLWLPPYSY